MIEHICMAGLTSRCSVCDEQLTIQRPINSECVASLCDALGNKWSAEVIRLGNALADYRVSVPDEERGMCFDRACKAPHYGYISATTTGTNARGRHNYGRKLTKQQLARVARPLPKKGESK